jgi:RNA polymerase sigma-70 factor (ECF subfamily)
MEVAGLDARQTAAALGLSVTSVRVARHRGLTRLRRSPESRPAFDPA